MASPMRRQFYHPGSRFHVAQGGGILHHGVDEVLLFGGASEARFGGGRARQPIAIYLCGRAMRQRARSLAGLGTRAWAAETGRWPC